MDYVIEFHPSARKAIDGLPNNEFRRVGAKVDALAKQPRPPRCTKLAGHDDLYRVRVGDWRIIYVVDDERRTVTVTIVAHRRESYRGL